MVVRCFACSSFAWKTCILWEYSKSCFWVNLLIRRDDGEMHAGWLQRRKNGFSNIYLCGCSWIDSKVNVIKPCRSSFCGGSNLASLAWRHTDWDEKTRWLPFSPARSDESRRREFFSDQGKLNLERDWQIHRRRDLFWIFEAQEWRWRRELVQSRVV